MKNYYILTIILLFGFYSVSQTVLWSEDFTGTNPDWTLNTSIGPNGAAANDFQINAQEHGGIAAGSCAAQSMGGNGNNSLSVYNPTWNSLLSLYGAHYYAGGLGDDCTTNKRAAYNQAISTIGETNLTLSFNWIGGGETGNDFGTVEYSTDGGTTWNNLQTIGMSPTCGSTHEWQTENIALPTACENIADLRFAFTWVNNNNNVGTDPSLAIDEMELTTPASTPGPTAAFTTANTTICVNDCIDFTDNSTGTNVSAWSWDFGNTTTSSIQNPTNICYTTPGTYTVTLTVTDDNGTDTETQTNYITVNALPTISITNNPANGEICNGQSIDLTASGTNTYAWDNGAGAGASVNVSPTLNTTYTVTGTASNGCINTATSTVTVNPLPTITANASPSIAICNGDQVTLTGSASGAANPVTYIWDNGVTDGTAFTPLSTTTYEVTGTDNNGCSNTDQVTITVNNCSVPTASFTVNNQVICEGDDVTFTDASTGTNVNSWNWDFGNTQTSTLQNPGAINYPTAGTYTVSLTVTDDNGMDDTIAVNYITVNVCNNPTSDFTISNNTPCTADCISFTDISTGTNISSWSWDFGGGASPNTSSMQNPSNICFDNTGTFTVSLTVTDDIGTNTSTQTITVADCNVPVAGFEFDTLICEGSCIDFVNQSSGSPTTYNWTFGGGTPATSADENPTNICFDTPGTYSVSLEVTNSFGSDIISQDIVVGAIPSISVIGDTTIDLAGEALLEATSNDAGSISWSPNGYLDCDTCLTVFASPVQSTNYIVYITTEEGCVASDTVLVLVNFIEAIDVPSAFSPNGDGLNDLLFVKGEGINTMNFRVFNRYGQLVFETDDQLIGWDGKMNGEDLNQGVFVYILDYVLVNGQSNTLKGNTTLIK